MRRACASVRDRHRRSGNRPRLPLPCWRRERFARRLRPSVRRRQKRVLCAFDKPRVVGEGAVRRGYGTVVLLDAALHFLEERFAKFGERFERFFRIGVLGFEIGADIAVERVRIAHHLAPVLVAKPGVVVDPDNAVVFVGLRPFFGARRRRGRCQFHVCAFNRRRRRRAR